MGKRRKFFIHPGYPKTASTTLQKALFSKHPDLCYLGKPLTGDLLDIEVAILNLDDGSFTQALPDLQQKFLAFIARCDGSDRNVLLSHEGFLRPTRYQGHDIQRTARRIWQVFCEPVQDEFDCHVLLTIRKQVDIIPSYYFASVSRSPARFRQFIGSTLQKPGEGYSGSLYYDEMVRHYADLFGHERVKVLLFEQFSGHREAFMQELAAYLEIDLEHSIELVGDSAFNIKKRAGSGYRITANEAVLDMVNKVSPDTEQLPRLLQGLLKRIPLKNRTFSLSTTEQAAIQQLYVDANRRLSDEFGLSLDEYDYY
jgi:hypothetical protein